MRRIPSILMRFGARRPRLVVGWALLTLLLAGLAATQVRIETDLLALVPKRDPVVSAFRETLERFGSTDVMLIAVEVGDDREATYVFADALAEELRASDTILWLEYRLEDLEEALPELVPIAPLYMQDDDLDAFLEALETPEGREREVATLAASLRSPAALGFESLRQVDPFGLMERVAGGLDPSGLLGLGGGGQERAEADAGYWIDPGGELLLMVAKPTEPPADLPFSRRLAAELEAREAAAGERMRSLGYDMEAPDALFAGGHLVGVSDTGLIVRDLVGGTLGALLVVVALFAFAFGRKLALFISFAPLLVGLVLTFGFAALALGRLSSATTSFAALLIGLGVDFVIVLYGRYSEERARGVSHFDAIDHASQSTAIGVGVGAVTTSATFYAFLISDFAGLWELGLLTGTGILLLLTTVYLLLPALLTLAEERRSGSGRQRGHRLRGFGGRHLFRLALRRPGATLVVAMLVTVLAATVSWFRLESEDDALTLRSADNPALLARDRIVEAFDLRVTPFLLRVDGTSEEEALERARELTETIRPLVEAGELARVESLARLIPSPSDQRRALAALAAFEPPPEGLDDALRTEMTERGLRATAFEPGLLAVEQAVARREPLRPSELLEGRLGHLLERYLAGSGDDWSTVVYAYPPIGARVPPAALVSQIEERPWASLSGGLVVSRRLRQIVWRDAITAALLGTAIVFLLLALDLKSVRRALLSLVPLGVGMVWMLGGMAATGVSVNLMNLFVFTMVIGIGVDYGIHLMHRWGEGDLAKADGLAAAVAVAALTTVCGFGSLVFSHFPGLRSVGAAAIFGTVSAAIVSVTVLPALLALIDRRRGRPPSASDHD